jgi:hypothetical protein
MVSSGALTVALALSLGAGDDRLLLCRPQVQGEAALARGEAVAQAGARLKGRFLEYPVVCDDAGQGARAARRAGLPHAVVSRAEGTPERTRFELVLADSADDAIRSRKVLEVKPGEDAVPPLKGALKELLRTLPPRPGPDPQHVAAWAVVGAGAAALVTGLVLESQAGRAQRRADRAADPAAYTAARKEMKDKERLGGWALGVGGVAVAAGVTWRFVF